MGKITIIKNSGNEFCFKGDLSAGLIVPPWLAPCDNIFFNLANILKDRKKHVAVHTHTSGLNKLPNLKILAV